jgi:hypothetical protein
VKLRFLIVIVCAAPPISVAQDERAALPRVDPKVAVRRLDDRGVAVVYVAPRYATAIRMPEPVNSVIVGDPSSFSVEHSEQEPTMVFVKPITTKQVQTNLLISTSRGQQLSLLLVSRGETEPSMRPPVDFLLRYKPVGSFLIEPAEYPASLVSETVSLADNRAVPPPLRASRDVSPEPLTALAGVGNTLDELLERQRKAQLPDLYGGKPGTTDQGSERIEAGVSEVLDQGREVVVLFAVVNPQKHSVELMPPQIQLGGQTRSGKLIKHSKWSTAEQYPIGDYRLSRRRIGAGERSDGVVVFNRPPFKQSNETLFLQIAESGAVDRPALAPIGFGISRFDQSSEGVSHGKASGR